MLDPVTEMVTEGDKEVKKLCLRANNSNVNVTVRFPDDLKDGKILEFYESIKCNVYVARLHSLEIEFC